MKKFQILTIVVLIILPTVAAEQNTTSTTSYFEELIPASDTVDFELLSASPTTLYTITINNLNLNETFNLFLMYANFSYIITRYDLYGENSFQFIGSDDNYILRIRNLETIAIDVDIRIKYDAIDSHGESGFLIETQGYRCWTESVETSGMVIIPIGSLSTGKHNVTVTVNDDGGRIGITLSSLYPNSAADWQEDTFFFTATSHLMKEINIEGGKEYMSITSLDLLSHSFTIFFASEGSAFGVPEIVIVAILITALVSLVLLQISSKKRRRGTGYYNHKISQKETNEKLKLSAQVDWRFEGSRYAYVPPDVHDPNLVKPFDKDED